MGFFGNDTESQRGYKEESSEFLQRLNRVAGPIAFIIVTYLTVFGDRFLFPNQYQYALSGRLFGLVMIFIASVASFIPNLKNRGYLFTSIFFAGTAVMTAHLSGIFNNDLPSVLTWLMLIIIFCGIYPLPTLQSMLVAVLSTAIYLVSYLGQGFKTTDMNFRNVLLTINGATLLALVAKLVIHRILKREYYFRKGLEKANVKIEDLQAKLRDESLRSTYLSDASFHVQNLALPTKKDYSLFEDLDIAGLLIHSTNVGGDYFDIVHHNKRGFITIGDVSGDGLYSAVILIQVHAAIRALSRIDNITITDIYRTVNRLVYDFKGKIGENRVMSLLIFDYLGGGKFSMTGQHESIIIIRANGKVENLPTIKYGLLAGMDSDIEEHLKTFSFELKKNDILLLYTNGVSNSINKNKEKFGVDNIIHTAQEARQADANTIMSHIINRCMEHIGGEKTPDDLTVLVVKKK